jgi:hypothetical protein
MLPSQVCTLRWCASPAVSWRSSDWPCWISDRHTSYQSSTAGMRYNRQTFTNNPDLLMNRSFACRKYLTTAYVTTSRYSGAVITNNWIKIRVIILVVEFENFLRFVFRYIAAPEDTTNLHLCGVLFMLLTTMCVVVFSAVTVNYWVELSLHTGNCQK